MKLSVTYDNAMVAGVRPHTIDLFTDNHAQPIFIQIPFTSGIFMRYNGAYSARSFAYYKIAIDLILPLRFPPKSTFKSLNVSPYTQNRPGGGLRHRLWRHGYLEVLRRNQTDR